MERFPVEIQIPSCWDLRK